MAGYWLREYLNYIWLANSPSLYLPTAWNCLSNDLEKHTADSDWEARRPHHAGLIQSSAQQSPSNVI